MNPNIPIDLDHDKYGWEDHNEEEEELISQMELDDIVPKIQNQEQLPTSSGGGGTHSLQASSVSGSRSIFIKHAKATTSSA